jgi:condensin complex subunit 2
MPANDDGAERAARRKSAHFGELSKGQQPDGQRSRVVSALAMQQAKKGKRLSAVAPGAPVVSMEVMNTNFEEWMKLATDNVSVYQPGRRNASCKERMA